MLLLFKSVTEEIILRLVKSIAKETGIKNLCMAGGVALKLCSKWKNFKKNILIIYGFNQHAGDAGGSLGAALAFWYQELKKERRISEKQDEMKGSYLGPHLIMKKLKIVLNSIGAKYNKLNENDLIQVVAEELKNQKTVGWFQGKMEFGPRALGARSIIADPRSEKMQKELNLKVKFRESFRPFAPSVLREDVGKWFELEYDSPYMLLVSNIKKNIRYQ